MTMINEQLPGDRSLPPGRKRRPWLVTFLALVVLILAVMFLVSAWDAASLWVTPLHTLVQISPAYLIGRGIVWGVLGMAGFIGLWRGLRWAPHLVFWWVVAFLVFYWLERILLTQVDAWGVTGWFSAGISILVIFLVWWILFSKPGRAFFGDKRE
jgi:hypothetical protein